ncbi:Uu.00g127040.m01.CDS01 [Anthostomella pinea]|uniref:Uu.00g127040.m01.CDS01 n=1 Tax=Anthostomella pinea TaxID=933095 RepID=A0AAI8YHR3_9PEZI|nr:Uu.00g127040.m01.CDS01 [Anthostomella pinea]
MVSPPWAGASSDEQYFVLLTGANSGVGLGIGQRTIDQFLASRPLSAHLILIPTTRSARKSRETILSLRAHLETSARSSKQLQARAGPNYDPQTAILRVHILSLQVDLCDLNSIYAAADQLVNGKLTDPTGLIDDVRIPRIDAALLNAGIGGWEGLNWVLVAKQFFSQGLLQTTTFPIFKRPLPSAVVLDNQKLLGVKNGKSESEPPEIAEVFCANVFGHYILSHELLPLLSRSNTSEAPGRVVWHSSIDAGDEHLDFDDFQARRYQPPYESSKRITDLLSLTVDLPHVRQTSAPYFSSPTTSDKPVKPRFYLAHPGIVCTPIFPLNWFLFFAYWCAMCLSRWCGSPWHVVESYMGACAMTWLALAEQDDLDAAGAQHVKWGSSCTRSGHRSAPKKTEVEGWAWEGRIEDPEALRREDEAVPDTDAFLRKTRGRKLGAATLTQEQRIAFEEDGRRCWEELERLRGAWETALGKGGRGNAKV